MVTLPRRPAPLAAQQPIVDEQGRPTRWFIEQWALQNGINGLSEGSITTLSQLVEAVQALQQVEIQAGTGLDGGGVLGTDSTISLDLANTAVTPGTYGDATNVAQITVNQQGQVTAAQNVAISGGGGGSPDFSWPNSTAFTFSSSAYASKGRVEAFFTDVEMSGLAAFINGIATHTYQAGIYALDGSLNITSVVATSSTKVLSSSGAQVVAFPITASLTAGTLYYFGIHRTDGGDTYANPMGTTTTGTTQMGTTSLTVIPFATSSSYPTPFGRVAKAAPAVSDTVEVGQNTFMMGLRGTCASIT